ncbi:MAG: hypothetical protein IT193_12125 [Propionibacteriaceae bacterium]|nr:hypothetical protein [Propionibacteriaceae bacterium]
MDSERSTRRIWLVTADRKDGVPILTFGPDQDGRLTLTPWAKPVAGWALIGNDQGRRRDPVLLAPEAERPTLSFAPSGVIEVGTASQPNVHLATQVTPLHSAHRVQIFSFHQKWPGSQRRPANELQSFREGDSAMMLDGDLPPEITVHGVLYDYRKFGGGNLRTLRRQVREGAIFTEQQAYAALDLGDLSMDAFLLLVWGSPTGAGAHKLAEITLAGMLFDGQATPSSVVGMSAQDGGAGIQLLNPEDMPELRSLDRRPEGTRARLPQFG